MGVAALLPAGCAGDKTEIEPASSSSSQAGPREHARAVQGTNDPMSRTAGESVLDVLDETMVANDAEASRQLPDLLQAAQHRLSRLQGVRPDTRHPMVTIQYRVGGRVMLSVAMQSPPNLQGEPHSVLDRTVLDPLIDAQVERLRSQALG